MRKKTSFPNGHPAPRYGIYPVPVVGVAILLLATIYPLPPLRAQSGDRATPREKSSGADSGSIPVGVVDADKTGIRWASNFEEAIARAREEQRILMLKPVSIHEASW